MTHNYTNTEVKHTSGGGKIVRKVTIKNGKGHKSVTKYHKGKKVGTAKKPIHKSHVDMILVGKLKLQQQENTQISQISILLIFFISYYNT